MFRTTVRAAFVVALVLAAAGPACPVRAELIMDPQPAMRWQEMTDAELVVVAKYQGHKEATLELSVVRVLKGDQVKPGDLITVRLEHWYSVETRPVSDGFRERPKDDGLPRLCYKQPMGFGNLSPQQVLPDVRQPAIYFFTKASAPVLDRRGQVQPEFMAQGWSQAVSKKPMDLSFRLLQPVDGDLQRAALEELYKTRDPKVIQTLSEWVLTSPAEGYMFMRQWPGLGPEEILARIGDRAGDLYDPLYKHWSAEAEQPRPYWRFRVATILARIDRERAMGDFTKVILAQDPRLATPAMSAMQYVRTARAVAWLCDTAFDQANPELASQALEQLRSELSTEISPNDGVSEAQLQGWARPRLEQALTSPTVPEATKDQIRKKFAFLLQGPPAVDLEQATKVLLNPENKSLSDGQAAALLKDIQAAADPKFIPLLVRIMVEVPAARGGHAYGYESTLSTYALLFPNALGRELEARKAAGTYHPTDSYFIQTALAAQVRMPQTIDQVRHMVRQQSGMSWVKAHGLPGPLLEELKEFIESMMDEQSNRGGPSAEDMAILLAADPKAGQAMLDKTLTWILDKKHRTNDKPGLLGLAVANGRQDLVDSLIAEVRKAFPDKEDGNNRFFSVLEPLLDSGDPEARKAYLALLDGQRRLLPDRWGNRLRLPWDYDRMLDELADPMPAEFASRVLDLAASPQPAERAMAQHALWTVGLDFAYRADAFEPQRREMLEKLRPMLAEAMALSGPERRGYGLRKRGVALEGPAGTLWLPALARACGDSDQEVAWEALRCLDQITGRPLTSQLISHPCHDRPRLVTAFLNDAGLLK